MVKMKSKKEFKKLKQKIIRTEMLYELYIIWIIMMLELKWPFFISDLNKLRLAVLPWQSVAGVTAKVKDRSKLRKCQIQICKNIVISESNYFSVPI